MAVNGHENGNGNGNSRVTNRELDAKLEAVDTKIEAVRQESKAEHRLTRLLFAIVSVPGALKALPTVLGIIGIQHGWVPWG